MTDSIIGIDLGTTNSVVAVLEGGMPRIIPTAEGRNLCPSVVGLTASGDWVVGDIAKRQLITQPTRTVMSVKRYMGTDKRITLGEKTYSPPEISAMILQKLRRDAEAFLGHRVTKAVITVPAYFSDAQRQATKDAGRIAGLDVVRIINEPTAASLAYGLEKQGVHSALVWDLGGGTFDVSVLTLGDGIFQVRSTCGDTKLGGDDWDGRLVSYLIHSFNDQEGLDLSNDRMAVQRLIEAAETAKVQMTSAEMAIINLPFLTMVDGQPKHLELQISRREFEALTAELRDRMVGPTNQALQDANMKPTDLDAVVLVGGSTRMPSVRKMVYDILHHEPISDINPDEVVALGAAIQGGILSGEYAHFVLLDVTPLSLGVETASGNFKRIIPRNTTIPTSESNIFTTSRDDQSAVEIHVLQGERDIAEHNISLARFSLTGIRPAPRGIPRIEVTFDIDENGIAHVSAKDLDTGISQHVIVKPSSGLSEEEIEAIILEAEIFATEDKERVEGEELRAQAEDLLAKLNARLDALGSEVSLEDLSRIDSAMLHMRNALLGTDLSDMRSGLATLREVSLALLPYERTKRADQDKAALP